jgi:ectoine hydroxylase-related dioxygenase (phytanoyl-CoA dioxygenase family)
MNIDYYINEIYEKGYTVIPNVLNNDEIQEYICEFNKWMDSFENSDELHHIIHHHGIFKYFDVGHQRFAWLIRTNSKIQNIFKRIWNTDEIVTSFDGCCYYPRDYNRENENWIHSDQSCLKKGLRCIQSFVSLTKNNEKTFMVYENSHKLHEDYGNKYNITNPSDWNPIAEEYLIRINDSLKILEVDAGSMVLWDSRTFHQNTCGDPKNREGRLIQYICFLPKNVEANNEREREKRKYYFENSYTTNHYPYPMRHVPKQPTFFESVNEYIIDYNKLKKPELDDLLPEIYKII